MKQLLITISANTAEIKIHNRLGESEKKIIKLKNEFNNLFYNNERKDLVVKVNLKEDANIFQQKGRPIPIHLQDQVAEELKTLIKNGYSERATELTEDCFVSPPVKTVKKHKSVKIPLDSRVEATNEATFKRKQMPNLEEFQEYHAIYPKGKKARSG